MELCPGKAPARAGVASPRMQRTSHRPQRNGGRHRCQPPLRRAKDMPVFVNWSALTFRPSRPALDPGSPAQASLSIKQLPPGEEPDRSTRLRGPKVRWSFDRSGLSRRNPIPRNWNPPVKTVRCSTALLGSTTLASRFVLGIEMLRTASRSRKIDSSGASSRLAPHPLPRKPQQCLPAEIGPLVPAAPSCRCQPSGEAGTAVPITY